MAQQRQKLNTIPKVYDPHQAEERIYKFWMDGGFFRAIIDPSREPFVIICLRPTSLVICTSVTPWWPASKMR